MWSILADSRPRRPKALSIPQFVLQPWHLLVMSLACIINREQLQVIEYLRTENDVLKEKLSKKRILLNDDQRRR